MAKKLPPLTRSPLEIDIEFYSGYDESLLFNKAQTLWAIAKSPERFQQFIDESDDISGTLD